jgi:hypothetical protein
MGETERERALDAKRSECVIAIYSAKRVENRNVAI